MGESNFFVDDGSYITLTPAANVPTRALVGVQRDAYQANVYQVTSPSISAGYYEVVFRVVNQNGNNSNEYAQGGYGPIGMGFGGSACGLTGLADATRAGFPANITIANPVVDLGITKTNNVSSLTNSSSTDYVIRVTNNGPDALTGAVLADPVAAGLTKTAIACTTGVAGNQCTAGTTPTITQIQSGGGYALPTLANSAFYELRITASVSATATSVSNVATIATPTGVADTNLTNNSATDTDAIQARVRIAKISNNGVGTFNFTGLTNLSNTTDSVTTATSGVSVTSAQSNYSTALNAAVQITESLPLGYSLNSASCTDANAATSGNPASPTTFGSLTGNQLTIPAVNIRAGADILCTFTNTAITSSISGTVYEDINYGGGAGRSLLAASGVARQNARVELYDAAGNFVTTTNTNVSGQYSFSGLLAGNYTVRVVNSSVTSSRTGYVAGLLPVQTFRTNASSGSAVADVNRVGGETPSLVDAANGSTTLAALTTGSTTAQSISPVTVGSSNITGLDFGYNFDTIVNTNDAGQGSLRQFILNSNALSNSGLAQVGNSINTRGSSSSLAAGSESSIFMIPNGTAQPGVRSGLTNQLTSGVAIIRVASSLPAITGGNTLIDGGTQTFNIGNTNTTTLNSASTVGIDNLPVPAIAGPEVQIEPTGGFYSTAVNGLTLSSNDNTVQNIAISGFTGAGGTDQGDIYVSAGSSGTMIRWNTVGIAATSYSDRGAGVRTQDYGIYSLAGSLTVRENIVAYVGAGGVELFNVSSILVEANELRGNAITNSSAENLNVNSGGGLTARGNLSRDAGGPGFDTSGSSGNNLFENNSVINNGRLETGQNSGVRLLGTNNTVRKNIIAQNYGAGILVRSGSTGNLITQNSIYANGTTGTISNQLGIDLTAASDNQNTGTAPFVTSNDANDSDSGANGLLNFPVFESVVLAGGNLILKGCAPAGATLELFESDVSAGKSSVAYATPNSPRSLVYGEGETYLTTLTEGSSDTDTGMGCSSLDGNNQTGMSRFAFSITAPIDVALNDLLTTTATVSNSTSEFSPVVRITAAPTVTKVFSPEVISPNDISQLTITLSNSNNIAATLVSDLTDTLPANVVIASNPSASTTCIGGTGVTGVFGAGSVSLASNAVIPANGSCTVSINVTSASAGVYSNTIAAGALRTTVGDNLLAATDDLTVNSLVAITGSVFNDNGGTDPVPATVIANAYNGTQNTGELGIAGSTVRLTNCAANPAPADVLATTQTDAAGDYRFGIVASQLSSPFCVTQTNLAGYTSVSGTAGYTRGTDTISIANSGALSYTGHNFGDARLNLVLTSDGQQTTTPSGTVSYPHILRSESVLSVGTLNTISTESPAFGWTTVLYRDTNCNGTVDGGESTLTSAIGQLLPNQEICVVQRVNAPANATNGAQHIATLSASYTATVQDSGVLSGSSNTRTDTTLVGTAGLDLRKQVRVVASCPSTGADVAAFTERNTAKNGEFLEYQIIYSNRSTRNLSQLTVRDVAPSNTTFQSATCQSTPSGSSCTAPVSAGVNGDLAWSLTNIAPAATGSVRFCVQVPPLAEPPIQ